MNPIGPDIIAPLSLHPGEVRFFATDGYLHLPGVLDPSIAVSALRETLHVLRAGTGLADDEVTGTSGRTHKLVQSSQYLKDSTLDRLVNSVNLQSIASQLLGGPASIYLPFTAVKSGGGGGRFSFHQDNQYTRFVDGLLGINIWIALMPMTPENGCLQICPRSHLRGTLDADIEADGHRRTKIEPTDFLPIRMSAGDAVAFTRLTVHGSGENITMHPRVAYAVQYHRDDALATWDNREPRLLKNANRWSNAPVEKLTAPVGRDGH